MNSRNRQKIKRIWITLLLAAVIIAMMSPGTVFALTSDEAHYRNFPGRPGVAALSAYDEEAMLAAALYTLNVESENFREVRRLGLRLLLGDINNDGAVTDLDVLLLRLYLAGHDVEIFREAADINADGRITAIDLMLLQLYLAGNTDVLNGQQ